MDPGCFHRRPPNPFTTSTHISTIITLLHTIISSVLHCLPLHTHSPRPGHFAILHSHTPLPRTTPCTTIHLPSHPVFPAFSLLTLLYAPFLSILSLHSPLSYISVTLPPRSPLHPFTLSRLFRPQPSFASLPSCPFRHPSSSTIPSSPRASSSSFQFIPSSFYNHLLPSTHNSLLLNSILFTLALSLLAASIILHLLLFSSIDISSSIPILHSFPISSPFLSTSSLSQLLQFHN